MLTATGPSTLMICSRVALQYVQLLFLAEGECFSKHTLFVQIFVLKAVGLLMAEIGMQSKPFLLVLLLEVCMCFN